MNIDVLFRLYKSQSVVRDMIGSQIVRLQHLRRLADCLYELRFKPGTVVDNWPGVLVNTY